MTEKCPHFGYAIPADFDCSGCTTKEECYTEWQRRYDEITEEVLSGAISIKKANEKFAQLGCEAFINV